jgi:thiosulfate/3-mercaptopyruvate sulfurtransferase
MIRILSSLMVIVALIGGSVMAESPEVKVNSSMLVSSEWLASHLHDRDLVILCVTASREFYERHIPGARYIPLDRLVSQGKYPNAIPLLPQLVELFEGAGIDRNSRIVIYGEKQGMYAARAYVTLDYLGLANNAALLDGGIEKWRAENREENSEWPKTKGTQLEVVPNPKILATLEDVKDEVHGGNAALLDARPHAEFTGEKRSEDVPRSGHIPGARGLYWQELLTSREMPTLRPPAELLAAYRSAGAVPGRTVVSYCRTGMQASVDYFVAKYLGFPSRIYVPSFYEWSRSDGAVESTIEHPQPK